MCRELGGLDRPYDGVGGGGAHPEKYGVDYVFTT
jgi:hypothetical protein